MVVGIVVRFQRPETFIHGVNECPFDATTAIFITLNQAKRIIYINVQYWSRRCSFWWEEVAGIGAQLDNNNVNTLGGMIVSSLQLSWSIGIVFLLFSLQDSGPKEVSIFDLEFFFHDYGIRYGEQKKFLEGLIYP